MNPITVEQQAADMSDQDLYEALTTCAYMLGGTRGTVVPESTYTALGSLLNRLSLVCFEKAGR